MVGLNEIAGMKDLTILKMLGGFLAFPPQFCLKISYCVIRLTNFKARGFKLWLLLLSVHPS